MSLRRRRTRRILTAGEDDLPLELLSFLNSEEPEPTSSTRKRKAVSQRNTRTSRPEPTLLPPPAPVDVVTIDDTVETEAIQHNVNEKVGKFMETGSFMSSDEDETEMIRAKTYRKASPNQFFISDDSDDDCKLFRGVGTNPRFDICEPGTSAGTSRGNSKNNELRETDEDFMGLIDSVLDSNKDANKQTYLKDMKSLEEFRKETEQMLKNASTLLDEIKTGQKREPEPKVESPKVTLGVCPICLESLANRPASVTVCGHIFCKNCITHTAQTLKKCPTCRKAISLKKIHSVYF